MTMAASKSERATRPVVERCACGKKISPMAKRLQNPNPALPRKCFSCLVRDGELNVVCW